MVNLLDGYKKPGELRHTCVIYSSLSDNINYRLIEYWSWRYFSTDWNPSFHYHLGNLNCNCASDKYAEFYCETDEHPNTCDY